MAPMRIIFAGTPDFAAHQLKTLLDCPLVDIAAVYCQPDRKTGRGKKLSPPPVKQLAMAHDLPVLQPISLKDKAAQDELNEFKAELMVVAAYGMILPAAVLSLPKYGCINVHASLLPRWRGAAPVERAIEAGDDKTGVTIMQMDEGLDTGDMLYKKELTITAQETGKSLREKLAQIGSEALIEVLQQFEQGVVTPEKQKDELACYAHKLTKQEAEIDWSQAAVELAGKIRAFNANNVCFTHLNDTRIKIWDACAETNCAKTDCADTDGHKTDDADSSSPFGTILSATKSGIRVHCGQGILNLQQLQLPGAKQLAVADILNARKDLFAVGSCFTTADMTNNG